MSDHKTYRQLLIELTGRLERLEYQAADSVRQAWQYTRDWLVETGEATEEEARRASWFLKRDLTEALQYLAQGGENLSNWLGIDWAGAEQELLGQMQALADKTQLEWLEWQEDWAHAGIYHQGELVLGGVLECCQCGASQTLTGLSEVLACSHCQSTEFRRIGHQYTAESDL